MKNKKQFLLGFLVILFSHSYSQTWSALGTGANNTVISVTYDTINNKLYAGGIFTNAGGSSLNYIASWNGSAWSALGSGILGSSVNAMVIYQGNLYVGGSFNTAGGIPANHIAKWDGTTWTTVGGGITSGTVVDALIVYNGDLYVGGNFSTVGGTSANNIAKWNGSTWSAVGSGTDAQVIGFTVHNSDLYVGGGFTNAGGNVSNCIAKWDGLIWSTLGVGMGGGLPFVYSLSSYNGNLYVGGTFTTAGGISAPKIAKWNGTNWSDVGAGADDNVRCLTVFNNELYAAGKFNNIGGSTINKIAKWNEVSWTQVNGGVTAGIEVDAICTNKNFTLYTGGYFTMLGSAPLNNIGQLVSTLDINEIRNNKQISTYPNPSSGLFNILISKPVTNGSIEIYNHLGQLVFNKTITSQQNTIDISNQANGIYFVKLICDNNIVETKKILKQ